MINNIDPNKIQDLLGKSSFKQPDSIKATLKSDLEVSLQVDYASIIKEAMQIPRGNTEAVKQAQKLLLSGQLEEYENIQAAADNIIKCGV